MFRSFRLQTKWILKWHAWVKWYNKFDFILVSKWLKKVSLFECVKVMLAHSDEILRCFDNCDFFGVYQSWSKNGLNCWHGGDKINPRRVIGSGGMLIFELWTAQRTSDTEQKLEIDARRAMCHEFQFLSLHHWNPNCVSRIAFDYRRNLMKNKSQCNWIMMHVLECSQMKGGSFAISIVFFCYFHVVSFIHNFSFITFSFPFKITTFNQS